MPCLAGCIPLSEVSSLSVPPPQRRWYRVHPITDELYFVRPDAGVTGRVGGPDAGEVPTLDNSLTGCEDGTSPVRSSVKRQMRTSFSMPADMTRMLGLEQGSDLKDTLDNVCKICFDDKAEVVVLPCKHGGMCESCLRRSLFSKPLHRGGSSCPFCRKPIKEVIRLYNDAAIPQYAYAIEAGIF